MPEGRTLEPARGRLLPLARLPAGHARADAPRARRGGGRHVRRRAATSSRPARGGSGSARLAYSFVSPAEIASGSAGLRHCCASFARRRWRYSCESRIPPIRPIASSSSIVQIKRHFRRREDEVDPDLVGCSGPRMRSRRRSRRAAARSSGRGVAARSTGGRLPRPGRRRPRSRCGRRGRPRAARRRCRRRVGGTGGWGVLMAAILRRSRLARERGERTRHEPRLFRRLEHPRSARRKVGQGDSSSKRAETGLAEVAVVARHLGSFAHLCRLDVPGLIDDGSDHRCCRRGSRGPADEKPANCGRFENSEYAAFSRASWQRCQGLQRLSKTLHRHDPTAPAYCGRRGRVIPSGTRKTSTCARRAPIVFCLTPPIGPTVRRARARRSRRPCSPRSTSRPSSSIGRARTRAPRRARRSSRRRCGPGTEASPAAAGSTTTPIKRPPSLRPVDRLHA